MRIALLALILAGLTLPGLPAQQVDWTKSPPRPSEHFIALLKIDTSNPPGNETEAAKYLQNVLAAEGIDSSCSPSNPTAPISSPA